MKKIFFLFLLFIPISTSVNLYTDINYFDKEGVYIVPIFVDDARDLYSILIDVKLSKNIKLMNYSDGGFLSRDGTYIFSGEDIDLTNYYDGYIENIFLSRSGKEFGLDGYGNIIYLTLSVEGPGSFYITNSRLFDSNGNDISHKLYNTNIFLVLPKKEGEKTIFNLSFDPNQKINLVVDGNPYSINDEKIELELNKGKHTYYLDFGNFRTSNREFEIDFSSSNNICISNWQCSSWEPLECKKGQLQKMTCKDLNGCENDEIKTRECETLNEIDKKYFCVDGFCINKILLISILVLLFAIFLFFTLRKRGAIKIE